MNVQDFMEAVESVYGSYTRPVLRGMVASKVASLTDERRALLFDMLFNTFSTRYGTQPDGVAINEALKELRDRPFVDGKPAGHYDEGRFIPDMTGVTREELPEDVRAASAEAASMLARRFTGWKNDAEQD